MDEKHRDYMRGYTQRNKDRINARRRELAAQRTEADKAKLRSRWRSWYSKNKKQQSEYKKSRREEGIKTDPSKLKEWRKLNRDKVRAQKRRHYHKDLEKSRDASRRRYARTKRRRRELARAHYLKHREKIIARYKKFRKENPEKVRQWRETNRRKRRAAYLLYGIKKKCRNDGLEFNLTVEWLQTRLDSGECELTGLPFDMVAKRGPNSPSVDRRDPCGPYTMENCRVILWFLNRAMSNLGEEYARKVFAAMLDRTPNA